jgi:uncharacterized membrane protein (DUF106 family)
MYYVQKIVQLILLIAVIVLGIENFNITVTGMSLLFLVDLPPTSVVFVVLASLLAGVIIMAFFSFVKDWRTVRENRIKISRLKNTIKDLELKSKDLQIVQNELDKLKIDHNTALSEVKTLKEVLSAQKTGTGNQVEY